MSRYSIGIDTGGTYTDAVILDAHSQRTVATAKAITTHGDLAAGVTQALTQVLAVAGPQVAVDAVGLVSLSTTLATNALVEGRGDTVAAFLIGFDAAMVDKTRIASAVPSSHIVRIGGGHAHDGTEREPLAVAAIEAALETAAGRCQAFSVAAHYAVRNPDHERRAQALIRARTGRPVTASSDLSDALSGPRRALTATLNARIVSLVGALEVAVRSAMARLGLRAPIMIVKGDGSLASARSVVERPIETILSGPAASVIGARHLTGLDDFVIADVGGTTTDVATVRDGWPRLNESGSEVAGHRTLVRAIDMRTVGLGGDSEVKIDHHGGIHIGADRVVPLALLACRWPAIGRALALALGSASGMLNATRYVMHPEGADPQAPPEDLDEADLAFLARVPIDAPVPLAALTLSAAARARVARLVKQGLLQVSGLTPSDAAHVLGRQYQWDTDAARAACELVGRAAGRVSGSAVAAQVEAFADAICATMVTRSASLVIEQLTGDAAVARTVLAETVAAGGNRYGDLEISLRPAVDLVAVGGPAAVFYPAVGYRLGRAAVVPDGAEVANAIGAAIGMVKVRAVVEVTSREGGGYLVHGDGAPRAVGAAGEALALAEAAARAAAVRDAHRFGGREEDIVVHIERIDLPEVRGEQSLMAATVQAVCVAAPAAGPPGR